MGFLEFVRRGLTGGVVCCAIGSLAGVQAADPPERQLAAGMSLRAFQKDFPTRIKNKFAPVSFSTHYGLRGRLVTSVVWEKRRSGRITMKVGLNSNAMKKEITDVAEKGYRLELMTGTGAGGDDRYSAVWSKAPGQEIAVRYGYPAKQLRKKHGEFKAKGFVIHSIMAVEVSGTVRLSAAWEKDDTVLRQLQLDLALGVFRREARERTKNGFRLLQACPYVAGRRVRVACIWEKQTAGPIQEIHTNLTAIALKKMNAKLIGKGYVPALIAGYAVNRRDRYIAAWEKGKP
ncbi:MAG: hypothetical protein ACE5KM_13050 [Planctomycetaceae bacterium]